VASQYDSIALFHSLYVIHHSKFCLKGFSLIFQFLTSLVADFTASSISNGFSFSNHHFILSRIPHQNSFILSHIVPPNSFTLSQFLYQRNHATQIHTAANPVFHQDDFFFFVFFFGFSSTSSSSSSQNARFHNFLIHLYARATAHTHVATNHAVRSAFFHVSVFHFSLSHTSSHCSHTQSLAFSNIPFSSLSSSLDSVEFRTEEYKDIVSLKVFNNASTSSFFFFDSSSVLSSNEFISFSIFCLVASA
jgi:hypothetical protein